MSIPCPCAVAGKNIVRYQDCCQHFHNGELPQTAEQLMRSRYSAFVLELSDYLLASWYPSTRPAVMDFSSSDSGAEPKQKWLGLQIKRHQQRDETHAIVEFVARYSINGRAHRLHETSNFIKEHNRWYYVDGAFA